MSMNYQDRIPNNVDLGSNRTLQRALEHWQPEFLKWLTNPATNPGALYDFGCYGADLMTWWMHGKAPISVTAVAQNARAGLKLSTRGLVLENGKVRLTGTGREILEHPEIGALYLGILLVTGLP